MAVPFALIAHVLSSTALQVAESCRLPVSLKSGRWLLGLPMLLASINVFACSCGDRSYDYWLEQAHTVMVVAPMQATVNRASGSGRDEIHATLELIDILKGDSIHPLPKLRSYVHPRGAACQTTIMLGEAYLLFLAENQEPMVYINTCGPNKQFASLRLYQEQVCFEGHHFAEECSRSMLDLLRQADNANQMYGFDEQWLRNLQETVRREIKDHKNPR